MHFVGIAYLYEDNNEIFSSLRHLPIRNWKRSNICQCNQSCYSYLRRCWVCFYPWFSGLFSFFPLFLSFLLSIFSFFLSKLITKPQHLSVYLVDSQKRWSVQQQSWDLPNKHLGSQTCKTFATRHFEIMYIQQ